MTKAEYHRNQPIRKLKAMLAPQSLLAERNSRRQFFLNAATAGSALLAAKASAAVPESWREPGDEFTNYGQPRSDRSSPIRWISNNPAVLGEGVSWTPLHEMEGSITPNGLHFERHHNGIPAVDVGTWELFVYGEVSRALAFSLDDLHRMMHQSRISFLECGGNSNALWRASPVQTSAGYLHGLVSCAEWTGVNLRYLLDVAGLKKDALWLIADGLDSAGVMVSLPLATLPEDALIALYQNGEPLRSANGFPARLIVPGWEGITNVKWLKSIHVAKTPVMSKFDTVSYTDLHSDGIAERFSFDMGVKSVITTPSPGQQLQGKGVYEIRGIAWSGAGKIAKVDISTDNKTWFPAQLQEPVLSKALTQFRMPWQWTGEPTVLLSRATDEQGYTQPTRQSLLDAKGANVYYHFNAMNSWMVDQQGGVSHVYV